MTIRFLHIISIFAVTMSASSQERFKSHSAILAGIDVSSRLSSSTGSFENQLGYRIAFNRTFNVIASESDALQGCFAIGYNTLFVYQPGMEYFYNNGNTYEFRHEVQDHQFRLSFADIGLGIGYSRVVVSELILSILLSYDLGIGAEHLTSNWILSETLGPSRPTYPSYMYGTHGEYNMDSGRLARGPSLGVSISWQHLVFDMRYRQTYFDRTHSVMPFPKKVLLSLGYIFLGFSAS